VLPASFSRRLDPQRTKHVRLRSSLAAALLDILFDHPLCKSVHYAKLSVRLTEQQGLRVFSQFSQHHL
jgi:hypothetical protein